MSSQMVSSTTIRLLPGCGTCASSHWTASWYPVLMSWLSASLSWEYQRGTTENAAAKTITATTPSRVICCQNTGFAR